MLPQFTSVGSYTILYLKDGHETLCAACATAEGLDESHGHAFDEGAAIHCEECNTLIESSYGNPERVVRRDGEDQFRGTENACFEYILKHQSQSVSWACEHEGWTIDED